MKTRQTWFLALSVLLCVCILYVQSKCVMTANDLNPKYPVRTNTEPFILDGKSQDVLDQICDNLNVKEGVCCNSSQVNELKNNFFLIDATFYHCRACVINYKRMWCTFTCSPSQSDYLTIAEYYPAPWDSYVKSVNYLLSMSFQEKFWESCQDNIMGSAVVKKLYPNVRNFLLSMQSMKSSNPSVNLKFSDAEEGVPGNLVPCEQMCYCAYCTRACSQKPPLEPDFSCRVGPGIPCWAFVGIVALVLGVTVLVAVAIASVTRIVRWYRNVNHLPPHVPVSSSSDEHSSLLYSS